MNYLLTDIPGDLHAQWKVFAALKQKTMREVLLDALAKELNETRESRVSELENELRRRQK